MLLLCLGYTKNIVSAGKLLTVSYIIKYKINCSCCYNFVSATAPATHPSPQNLPVGFRGILI